MSNGWQAYRSQQIQKRLGIRQILKDDVCAAVAELFDRVVAGRDTDRRGVGGVRAGDVVRRVAHDEYIRATHVGQSALPGALVYAGGWSAGAALAAVLALTLAGGVVENVRAARKPGSAAA